MGDSKLGSYAIGMLGKMTHITRLHIAKLSRNSLFTSTSGTLSLFLENDLTLFLFRVFLPLTMCSYLVTVINAAVRMWRGILACGDLS